MMGPRPTPSPQYPRAVSIQPDRPNSQIKLADTPLITTDSFMFGTTTNNLDRLGCIVEMDDAVIGMVCQEYDTPFGFVRNVSDPVINGDLPDTWIARSRPERGLAIPSGRFSIY